MTICSWSLSKGVAELGLDPRGPGSSPVCGPGSPLEKAKEGTTDGSAHTDPAPPLEGQQLYVPLASEALLPHPQSIFPWYQKQDMEGGWKEVKAVNPLFFLPSVTGK